MKRTALALLLLTLTLSISGGPNTKEKQKPPGFEGKHPVFVVVCIPNVYCGGFYMDKKDAVRAGIPKCSAKITTGCYLGG